LVICGPAGFRDFWPEGIAASLRRVEAWGGGTGPSRIDATTFELPGAAGRRNLSGLDVARFFDDPAWRDEALDAIARAVDVAARAGGRGPGRVALPAVLGLDDHAAVFAAAAERLPLVPFEVPLVPPSVPGIRLHRALRSALRKRDGRLQVGEAARGSIGPGGIVAELVLPAATRELRIRAGLVILATGGIAGGGIVATDDGSLVETVLGLPVEGPRPDEWLSTDPFDPAGHGLELAGVRTDTALRPVRPGMARPPIAENVRIAGSLLAGQRYLREHCGDGVAISSGRVAASTAARSSLVESTVR
jgi:glycerol-3-phosphate dehydrogenase subunit B